MTQGASSSAAGGEYVTFPSQTKSWSEKTKNDYQWGKNTIDAICNMSSLVGSGNRWRIQRLYDAVNGIIHDDDYNEITRPYGKKRSKLPTELRNYPLINTDLGVLLGEKDEMGLSYEVLSSNPDVETEKEKYIMDSVEEELQQEFINGLNEEGEDTGYRSEQTQDPKEKAKEIEREFKSWRSIMGQEALNYIAYQNELHSKFMDGWNHYLTSGYVFSVKHNLFGDLYYDILNPPDVDYDMDSDQEFVEDGEWALYRKLVKRTTVIDMFYNDLSKEQRTYLENPNNGTGNHQFPNDAYGGAPFGPVGSAWSDIDQPSEDNSRGMQGTQKNYSREGEVELVYVCWKARRKIGFLSYYDITGTMREMVVDEDYKPRKELGEKVEWKWVNEVWEGWKIDNQFYIKVRPVPNQRNRINNKSECKLPINGRAHSNMNTRNISFVELGLPFQTTYNIYKYKLNNAVAKAKDVIALLDINIKPKNWSIDKWMYMIETSGIGWVNYAQLKDANIPSTHQNVLDLSLKTIDQYIAIINQVVAEWERVSGISAQRRASINAYQGKATTEQAIIQSSYMTDDYFRKFERFENRELQGLLDYSKIAWSEGKKGSYVSPEGKEEFLSIDSTSHMESEYTIFATSSRKRKALKDSAKEFIQPLIQNGASHSAALDILQSNSFEKIQEKIREAEKTSEKVDQMIQKAKQEGFNEGRKQTKDFRKRELDLKEKEIDEKYNAEARSQDIEEEEVEKDYEIDREKIELEREKNDQEDRNSE